MVKLTMIARVTDGLPLAEGLDDGRDVKDADLYKQQAKRLFMNFSQGHNEASRMSIETGPYYFHYINEGHVCYLTMCDRSYPKKLAFQYLEDLKNEFERVNGSQIETAARPYAFIKFDTFIQKTKRLYADTRTQRNMAKLNDELYEVHQIMTRNVQEVLGVGECASTNTKFCYYNNYSLSQPRYFCKGCRRYWTQGGSLRNVPVGGGCRRNKRSSNSSSSSSANSSSAKAKALLEPNNPMATSSNPLLLPTLLPPPIGYDPSDLTLAFHATLHKQQPPPQASTKHLGLEHDSTLNSNLFLGHPGAEHIPSAHTSGFLDILRTGFVDTRSCTSGLNNFYYGFAGGNGSGLELGSLVGDQDQAVLSSEGGGGGLVGAPASTMTRQGSSCKDMDEADATKVLMGFPWQVAAGDHHGSGMSAVDSAGRDYWAAAGIAASSWHGLINNPLM